MGDKINIQKGGSNAGKSSSNSSRLNEGYSGGQRGTLSHSAVNKPVPGKGGKSK